MNDLEEIQRELEAAGYAEAQAERFGALVEHVTEGATELFATTPAAPKIGPFRQP